MSYAALWCKSNYSFLEGASHPEELVEEAHRHGLAALALTDRDGVYGVVRAHQKARELGVKLILGAQVSFDPSTGSGQTVRMSGAAEGSVVLLVQDRQGWANLCQLLTVGRLRSEKGKCQVTAAEVCQHASGLLALLPSFSLALCEEFGSAFFDRLYVLVARHRRAEEVAIEAELRAIAERCNLPVVAGSEVLYHQTARRRLQDVVTCIRHGVTLHTAGRLTKPNAEHFLKSPYAFATLFADDEAAVARTREIVSRCTFSLSDLRYRYPSERLPDGKNTAEWLRELTFTGARKRYGGEVSKEIAAQLDKELALIEELDYCGYFLTMWEIVEFCRHQNILCQGRGSAANSAVCFCLGITAVDPVRMKLLFERFLSRERAEPPDIDLDIEHERREEVIQHVYQKYGRSRAAMVANVIRYRVRSAIRDVGKVLGISETSLDRLAKLSAHDELEHTLQLSELDVSSHPHQLLLQLANEICDFPRHLSIHPGGFLLGHEPVSTLVPIENATMENRTVIQWDKDDVEALGLFKVDLLGLGALTHLHRAFDLISLERRIDLSLATIPEGDEATYTMIQRGDTVGVFQIESRAQMSMLPRLKPKNYYDLVIEVSIVRPGPITGGMVHPYLRRRNGEEPVDYPHPCLIPVLQKTLGVPLFQEQVMQLAVVAADYTPGEADQLRRDMAAWRRSGRIEAHRERLISRMQKKGIAPEFAERVFKQICGFGEYGFPESHAASFAIISYAGSYLKCHFPAEFTCALLSAQPMGFYAPSTIVEDAKRHGARVLPIDVGQSHWQCTMEKGAVRMGLRYVKGFSESDGEKIVAARPFESLDDLTRRSGLGRRALSVLAEADAFASLKVSRRSGLWNVRGVMPALSLAVDDELPTHFAEPSDLESINWDYRRSSHSTRGHPLGALRNALRNAGLPDARTLSNLGHAERVDYAGLVICRQHPGTAAGVTFMTLEDETGFVNVVVWKQVFDAYAVLARSEAFLGITGKLQVQEGVVHLIAQELWRPCSLVDLEQPASTGSHDFR